MSAENTHINPPESTGRAKNVAGNPRRHKGLRILLWCLSVPLVLLVAAVGAATWYLTSGRVTDLINTRASEYFLADVHASKIDFTIWQTFPRVRLEVDSLNVVSRTLRGKDVSRAMRATLPADADSLAFMRRMSGSVNVLALLAGKVELHDVEVSGLKLNMVTLNDSVNNFDILPTESDEPFDIPYISANSISLSDLHDITFYSAPEKLSARASLSDVSVTRTAPDADSYALRIKGNADADLEDIRICRNLPFLFGGDIRFRFDPFGLSMENMSVNLANTVSRMSMSMNFGDNPGIDSLRTEISTFDLMKLLEYLPAEFLPDLSGVDTDLRTGISIHLTAPYRFSSGRLPSFVADLTVPDSQITYTLDTGETYTIRGITLRASLTFAGDDWRRSRLDISELRAAGEGLSLLLSGDIAGVFDNPEFAADVKVEVDVPRLADAIPSLRSYAMSGHAEADATMKFPLAYIDAGRYADIPFAAHTTLRDFAIAIPGGTRIAASGTVDVDNADGSPAAGKLQLHDVDVRLADGSVFRAPKVDVAATRDGNVFDLKGDVAALDMNVPKAGLKGKAAGVTAAYPLFAEAAPLDLAAARLSLDLGCRRVVSGTGVKVSTSDFKSWHADAARADYSMPDPTDTLPKARPLTAKVQNVSADISDDARTLKNMKLKVARAVLNTTAYPEPIVASGLVAEAPSLNRFILKSLRVRSMQTAFDLAGALDIDRSAASPAYKVRATIDFDTLHFNRIARIYESGTAYHPSAATPDSTAARDTAPSVHEPFLVPANFDVVVDATAKATVYTNLWLTDLQARLRMQPGVLSLDTVSLAADFGRAGASIRYTSPDVQDIGLDMAAAVRDFKLTEFFESYPKVLAMMPQMKNLHGVFHADARLHTGVFPTMNLNTASMVADADVAATDLYLHQTNFIRNLARMALIFEKGDIHIPTVRVRARVFDHLLEVDPFDILIGKYHLQALGRNDFSGNLYYHVGVLRNPLLPIHFGINVVGTFDHPKLRFSGPGFDYRKSAEINHIDVTDNINLIDEAGKYGWMMIHHAAEADRKQSAK